MTQHLQGALIILLLSISACASPRRGEPVAGPLHLDSTEARNGQRVFDKFCDKCHPGGEAGKGPALNNKPLPAPLIKAQVRMGMGAMPGFSRELLPPKQLDDLTVYMKALRGH